MACINTTSCDFTKNKNNPFLYSNTNKTESIKINIEEAKVLSDISILNESVIDISQLAQEKSKVYSIKVISNKLNKESIEIKKDLDDLAEKKLILLPNRLDKKAINKLSEIDEASFSETYLKKVIALLESEMAQLEYLSAITNDVDFKVLTIKILVKLNYNLNQIHKTLK